MKKSILLINTNLTQVSDLWSCIVHILYTYKSEAGQ